MQSIRTLNPVLRAVGVFAAVAVLVSSVTFAALQSQATLTNNQFATGTANLKIWDGETYQSEAEGFNLTKLVPGTDSNPYDLWLKNDGTIDLNVDVVSSTPTFSAGVLNASLINVKITSVVGGESLDYPLSQLYDATPDALPGAPLAAGAERHYTVVININPDAVTGDSASVSDMNWTFTGTQVLPD